MLRGGVRNNFILVRIGGMDLCRSSTFRKKLMFLLIELQTNINFLTELVKPVSIKLSCCAINVYLGWYSGLELSKSIFLSVTLRNGNKS